MDKLKVVDLLMYTVRKVIRSNLTSSEWQIICDHFHYAYTAGFEEGWRQRSAKHSFKKIAKYKDGQEIAVFDSLQKTLNSIGGGSKSNLAKAAKGQGKVKGRSHRYRGYDWYYQ